MDERKPTQEGVHQTHCCVLHGCKYGDDDCPVVSGDVEQEYPCEACGGEGIETVEDVKKVKSGQKKICPHCHHVL